MTNKPLSEKPAYELFLNKIDKIMGEFKDE